MNVPNSEYVALRSEIDRIADNTQWNGQNILDGSAGPDWQIDSGFSGWSERKTDDSTSFGNVTTTGHMSALHLLVVSCDYRVGRDRQTQHSTRQPIAISAQRATFGAVSNRLTHAIDNLTNVKTNSEAARSRILDTDYSVATSEMARAQIIQQAGTAMLAQANALPQTVLALLK